MRKNLRNRVLIIAGVILTSLFCTFPFKDHIPLGMDLEGGMHLILRVHTEDLEEDERGDAVPRSIEILRRRLDPQGTGEMIFQQQGTDQILVQLPGEHDKKDIRNKIGTTAKLSFNLVNSNPSHLQAALTGKPPIGYKLLTLKDDNTPILVANKVSLKGEHVKNASVEISQQGFQEPYISLSLDRAGGKIFGSVTKNNVGQRLAIILDDDVISAPSINEAILSGNAQISGQFSFEEARLLAALLKAGSLPAKMTIEEDRTIGPLLGKDSIKAGILATQVGGILVLLFMFIYYKKVGLISNIALILNLILIFGLMGLLNILLPSSQITLTLPGIAGIILTLGMAVDANVLINERIREELANDRPLKAAINNGFNRALKAIVDSNSTTLIAALMLFQFGSGPIKGFAVTLAIGLTASLFTALFVTRTIFEVLLETKMLKNLSMLSFFKNTNIDFVSKRHICFILSIVLVIASAFTLVLKNDTAYGIDFAGGQIQEYRFTTPLEVEKLRTTLTANGIEKASIQQIVNQPENIIIRTAKETDEKVEDIFNKEYPDNAYKVMRVEFVGPVVGKALRKNAILAIVFALLGIMIFVGFRFKHWDFAGAGVIALLHDVFVTLGILVMLGRQVDLLVVTALLTIAGYSINDTIIIYDRVRENLTKSKKESLSSIINHSINQTLGRTILTTITTLIVVVSLYLKGGEILNTFALTLIIGFLAGTYSTIFIASPLVLAWEKKEIPKNSKKNK